MLKTPRGAILLVFAAFGAIVGSHVGALPVIVKAASVNPEFFGRTQAFAMLSALLAVVVAGVMSRRFDHRSIVLASLPACLIALVLALLVRSPEAYLASNLALAGALSFLDLNMNAEGSAVEDELKQPVFTTYHASVSLLFAASAIFSSIMSVEVAVWAPSLFAGILVIWAFIEVYRLVPRRIPHGRDETAGHTVLPRFKLMLIGLTIGLSNSCEISAMLWAGQLLAELKPELIAYSGLGAAFFGICGGTMRLFGDRLRVYFGDVKLITVSLALAATGFAVLGFKPGFVISVVAFASVGAGLGFVFPYLFSLAGRQIPEQRAAAMGFASAVSGGPRFVVPWFLGILATWYSINAVFAVCAVMSIGALGMVALVLSRYPQTHEGRQLALTPRSNA
jgi:Major Facilitator Superfamily